jgi:hypothetical protein
LSGSSHLGFRSPDSHETGYVQWTQINQNRKKGKIGWGKFIVDSPSISAFAVLGEARIGGLMFFAAAENPTNSRARQEYDAGYMLPHIDK